MGTVTELFTVTLTTNIINSPASTKTHGYKLQDRN
jgi:hypothetical protein